MLQPSFGPSPYFLHGHIEAPGTQNEWEHFVTSYSKMDADSNPPCPVLPLLHEKPAVPDHEAAKPGKQ